MRFPVIPRFQASGLANSTNSLYRTDWLF